MNPETNVTAGRYSIRQASDASFWGIYDDSGPDGLPGWIADCGDEGTARALLAALDLADKAHAYLEAKRAWDNETGMGDKDIYLRFFRAERALWDAS